MKEREKEREGEDLEGGERKEEKRESGREGEGGTVGKK